MAIDRELGYNINDVLGTTGIGQADEAIFGEDTLDPTNTLLLGSIARTSTQYGKTATVKAGEDIRTALESLKSAGGGTLLLLAGTHTPTYDIVGDNKINIVGEGIDQTIIDFQATSSQIIYSGKNNFRIENLTVQGTASSIDYIYVTNCTDFSINYCKTDNVSGSGFYILGGNNFTITNCIALNGTDGFLLESSSTNDLYDFVVINCFTDNCSDGFYFNTNSSNVIYNFKIIGCTANGSSGDGFECTDETNIVDGSFVGCQASGNSDYGFEIKASRTSLIGCTASSGTKSVLIAAACSRISLIACQFTGDYDISGDATVVGCTISEGAGGGTAPFAEFTNIADKITTIQNTLGGSTTTEKTVLRMLNTSGGNFTAGDVVILKSAADGDEVTSTTTQGDDKVFGMCLETHNDTNYRSVLVEGYTKLLKVNGTTAISVGDFLGTYTSAGIAMKAAAGDMAFAIALEAYSTADSNGIIDALIIKPRKI